MLESFGDYKVLEQIGAGGVSEVYRARDTRAGRTTAIKVLTADVAVDPVRGQPIADEAFLARSLGHPNVATLYDIGEQEGRPHLVYEFVQGQTLGALLGGKPINPRRALEFATQIADALADAHALGLVHRSLTPDTVMISAKGNAKVLDFGLGHYATAVATGIAATGASVPAMRYWAPEQRTGVVEARCDIYSLGLILVEMLTGRFPPTDGSPPSLSNVPTAFQPLLGRMLEMDPPRRADSAATIAAELRQLTATLEAQRGGSPPPGLSAEGPLGSRTSPAPNTVSPAPVRPKDGGRRTTPAPLATKRPPRPAPGADGSEAVARTATVIVIVALVLAVVIWWLAV